jgi:vacuolar-type H+-ATPase subunit H
LIEINDLCILVKNQWQTPKSETWKRKGEIINNASRKIKSMQSKATHCDAKSFVIAPKGSRYKVIHK